MGQQQLAEALKDCNINFDRRVLITDLFDKYEVSYKQIENILEEYIKQQEAKGVKYEKRFLVHGMDKECSNEIFTIVDGEDNLSNCLPKLNDAKTSLYSIEIAGGAKAPAQKLTPIQYCKVKLVNIKCRNDSSKATNGYANGENSIKPESKMQSNGTTEQNVNSKQPSSLCAETNDGSIAIKDEAKPKACDKRGTSFFAASSTKADSKSEGKSKSTTKPGPAKKVNDYFKKMPADKTADTSQTVQKSTSPKKMQDYFKSSAKTAVKCEQATTSKSKNNTSKQLFSDEEESSDEEEKLEALRRDIISSDKETDETPTLKRRRIVDSEDEDDKPQQKHEKSQTKDEQSEETKSETYLDDEGFVITFKSKKPGTNKSDSSAKIKPPQDSPPKPPPTKSKPAATNNKTKQGNIMSFFNRL